jgi:hypothetical protein
MNRKQYIQEQRVLRLLDDCRNKDINKLKGSGYPAETDRHYMAKAKKCKELLNKSHRFVTEAKFKYNKGRCDVLDITEGIGYEIVCSEKEESIVKKRKKYPVPIEVIKI